MTIVVLASSSAAMAGLTVSFQSFNGSVLFACYPQNLIVLEGYGDFGSPFSEN